MDRALSWFGPAATLALFGACGTAHGQSLTANFEAPTYTTGLTTGQNGWYLPVTSPVSLDHSVYAYAGNPLGIAANPTGGSQFDGGQAMTTTLGAQSARAQHAVDFSAGGVWEASWDCTGLWLGTPPAVNNLGSWSMQNSVTTRYFQQLMSWGGAGNNYQSSPNVTAPPPDHLATADLFHIHIGYFTAASPTVIAFAAPDPAWIDIPVNHWMHVTVRWDFNSAQILRTSIRDITAGTPEVVTDVSTFGWYLQGGPGSTMPLPTDVRLFAGGSTATGSDVSAWDNVSVAPAPPAPSCYANCDGSTAVPFLNVLDFNCFVNRFQQGDSYANCDGSTQPPVLNVLDFNCFVNAFQGGCSAP
jgi:hypothetical protein